MQKGISKRRYFIVKLGHRKTAMVRKLAEKFNASTSNSDRERIIDKALQSDPHLCRNEFLQRAATV